MSSCCLSTDGLSVSGTAHGSWAAICSILDMATIIVLNPNSCDQSHKISWEDPSSFPHRRRKYSCRIYRAHEPSWNPPPKDPTWEQSPYMGCRRFPGFATIQWYNCSKRISWCSSSLWVIRAPVTALINLQVHQAEWSRMFVLSAGILSIWRESVFIYPQENLHVNM